MRLSPVIALLLPIASTSVIVRKPVPHIVEDIVPRRHHGLKRDAVPVPESNATTTINTSPPSTITSAPWPSYSTSYCPDTPDSITTDYCRVHPGTVQVHFFPTGAAAVNRTYPKTYYNSEYGFTMYSPSVYYVIDKIWATNYCGQEIGPPQTNFIWSYNLDQRCLASLWTMVGRKVGSFRSTRSS
ncbi:hypothetical protein B0O99DRAFT_101936 [Bisporella sp. PMI_857]|nr:hypothetical protein B0O99DRAFT_101936 [Bisporella sp. PMI_857]